MKTGSLLSILSAFLLLSSVSGCDCSGDDPPSCRFIVPEADALLVPGDDEDPDTAGFQVLVELSTTRVASGTSVTFSAESADGDTLDASPVLPIIVAAGGAATGEVTLRGVSETDVVLTAAVGSHDCTVAFRVEAGGGCEGFAMIDPEDGDALSQEDDVSDDAGFQYDVVVATAGLSGTATLRIDGAVAAEQDITGDTTTFESVTLNEGSNDLSVEVEGCDPATADGVVADGEGPACTIGLPDPDDGTIGASDDRNDVLAGIQPFVVGTDAEVTGAPDPDTGVQIFVDDAAAGSEADVVAGGKVAGLPNHSEHDDATIADGNHTVHAECRDAAGNVGRSADVIYDVDSTAPSVTIESPLEGAILGAADDCDAGADYGVTVVIDTNLATGSDVTVTVDGVEVDCGPVDAAGDVTCCVSPVPDGDVVIVVTIPGDDAMVNIVVDSCVPSEAISDLAFALDDLRGGTWTANFTAVDDCGGPAESYDLRCGINEISMDAAAFDTATAFVVGGGPPAADDLAESRAVDGFRLGVRYHCSIKAVDVAGQASPFGNVVDVTPNFRSSEGASPGGAGTQFGFAIAPLGDVNDDGQEDVIVGSLGDRAYIFFGTGAGIAAVPDVTLTGPAGSGFGTAVAGIGDFVDLAGDATDDGLADIVVGAGFTGVNFEGAAYVFRGRAAWPAVLDAAAAADIRMTHNEGATDDFAFFGYTAAWAGDFDDDGRGDMALGAQGWNASAGAAYLIPGPGSIALPAIWNVPADLVGEIRVEGSFAGGELGSSLSSACDVDGDGLGDVAIGASSLNGAQFAPFDDPATVYIFTGLDGAAAILDADADSAWSWDGPLASAAGGGLGVTDVNGDGDCDLVVGAPWEDRAALNDGAVYVFFGDGASFPDAPDVDIEAGYGANSAGDSIGWTIAPAVSLSSPNRDVDEDGNDELLFGTAELPFAPGRGVLFYGGPAVSGDLTAETDADAFLPGLDAVQLRHVAFAGDVNLDGWVDLLFADPYFGGNAGRIELVF